MHHEVQVKNKEKYHYLAENIRIGKNKWKRVRVYLGMGNLPKSEIKRLISKNMQDLEEKVTRIKKAHDPLLSLLEKQQVKNLEIVRRCYQKSIGSIDKALWLKNYEWFVTQLTYDTNAIEGSSVTLQETGLILFDKVVPKGKAIEEIREVENHKEAFDLMLDYRGDITKRFVLKLHKKLMHNILWEYAGRFRDVQVRIRGTDFLPPLPERVGSEFKTLMKWYASNKKKYHPVVVAAYFHSAFEAIHPFMDGNGRVGRLLLNFILRKNGFPIIDIKNADKAQYYSSLQEAQMNGNLKPFTGLIAKYILESKVWI